MRYMPGRRLLRTSLRGLDTLLTWPVRVGRRPRVLFEFKYHVGLVAAAPLLRELHRRGNVELTLAWSPRFPVTRDALTEFEAVGMAVEESQALRHRRFECVVQSDRGLAPGWRFRGRTYLHHGSGAGNMPELYSSRTLVSGEVEFVLALNDEEREHLAKVVPDPQHQIRRTGCIKVEQLLREAAHSRPIPGLRRVLVLSHWNQFALHKHLGREVLAHLAGCDHVELTLSGHPHLLDRGRQREHGGDWVEVLEGWAREFGARLVRDPGDTVHLMAHADMMVGDHSSSTLEFAALGRPFAYFGHPEFPPSSPKLRDLLPRAGARFQSADEVPPALDAALSRIGAPPSGDQLALVEHCFPERDAAVRHAADAIEQIAHRGTLRPG